MNGDNRVTVALEESQGQSLGRAKRLCKWKFPYIALKSRRERVGHCDSETWEAKEIDGGCSQRSKVTGEDLGKCLVSNCCLSREGLGGNH